ncbi:MAG: hypothetical protein DMG22_18610 [Acidobacteria bacterium]|nr:MAG: hypothetical protein DMG22_18610 [Acidobacteriota bacterium]
MAIDVEKLLNVRRSELRTASLLFFFLFLAIGSYIIGISVGLAMFLNAYPNGLPHVIMATALVVAGFISIYRRGESSVLSAQGRCWERRWQDSSRPRPPGTCARKRWFRSSASR